MTSPLYDGATLPANAYVQPSQYKEVAKASHSHYFTPVQWSHLTKQCILSVQPSQYKEVARASHHFTSAQWIHPSGGFTAQMWINVMLFVLAKAKLKRKAVLLWWQLLSELRCIDNWNGVVLRTPYSISSATKPHNGAIKPSHSVPLPNGVMLHKWAVIRWFTNFLIVA